MPARFATQAVWLLRLALVVQCGVQAATFVFDPLYVDSPAYEMLVRGMDADPLKADALAQYMHIGVFAAALALVVVPLLLMVARRADRAGADRWPWTLWQIPILLVLFAWNILLLVADAYGGGDAMGIAARACAGVPRVAVPLALCVLCFRRRTWSPRDVAVRVTIEVLRIAAVAAFAALGWWGVNFDPALIDAVLGTAHHVIGWSMSEDIAELVVCGTGIIAAALAVFVLFFRWQGAAVAMVLIATAWLLVALGEGGLAAMRYLYPEAVLHFATVATPLAMLLLARSRVAKVDVEEDEDPDEELVIVGATEVELS